jgi:hypothetical protein
VSVTHYASILLAGYLSLIHPFVPIIASSCIAITVSLILFYRQVHHGHVVTNGLLMCFPVVATILLSLAGWPLYRIPFVTSLLLWMEEVVEPTPEIDGCRVALAATIVQSIAAFGHTQF